MKGTEYIAPEDEIMLALSTFQRDLSIRHWHDVASSNGLGRKIYDVKQRNRDVE